ncbi:hypothetical protein KM043_016828 [Ampulex compressa]|nr:hypothetical protein KM043_016828 [Ampulex compressa]
MKRSQIVTPRRSTLRSITTHSRKVNHPIAAKHAKRTAKVPCAFSLDNRKKIRHHPLASTSPSRSPGPHRGLTILNLKGPVARQRTHTWGIGPPSVCGYISPAQWKTSGTRRVEGPSAIRHAPWGFQPSLLASAPVRSSPLGSLTRAPAGRTGGQGGGGAEGKSEAGGR